MIETQTLDVLPLPLGAGVLPTTLASGNIAVPPRRVGPYLTLREIAGGGPVSSADWAPTVIVAIVYA